MAGYVADQLLYISTVDSFFRQILESQASAAPGKQSSASYPEKAGEHFEAERKQL